MGRKASGLGKDGRVALNRAIRPFYFDWTANTFRPVILPAEKAAEVWVGGFYINFNN